MTQASITHAEKELVEFLRRSADRYRRTLPGRTPSLERERHTPMPSQTLQAIYDQETERLRAVLTERRAA